MPLPPPPSRRTRWWSVLLLAMLAAVGLSCGDDGFTTAGPDGGVISVRISERALLLVMGDTVAMSAVGFDRSLAAVSGKTPRWTSSNTNVAFVDERSILRAKAPGVAAITAEIDGRADTAQVTVIEPPVARLEVSPSSATIIVTQQRQLVATAFSAKDSVLTGRALAWSSDDEAIATVDANGIVRGAGLGTAVITVRTEGRTATAAVAVVPVPVKQVVVEPNPLQIRLGTSVQLTAQARDSVGGLLAGRTVTWTSSADAVASVSDGGLVTGLALGTSTVTATSEGVATLVPVTVGAPSIALGSSTATFSVRHGAANPPAQTVAITNGGAFTLDSLSATVAYGDGQPTGWLPATLDQIAAPAALTLAPTTAALAPGTYTAVVTVSSPLAGVEARTLAVTLAVTPFPVIELGATAAGFTAQAGAANPAAQAIAVTNAGSGTLDGLGTTIAYGAGQSSGWLTATLDASSAPATLTLGASAAIEPGSYTATVTIGSSTPDVAPRTIDVTYAVSQPAVLSVSSSTLTFGSPSGGSPAPRTLDVTNAGTGVLTGLGATVAYAAGQPTGWLAVALDRTSAAAVLTATATSGSLPVGSYDATITVASAMPGVASRAVAVSFTVSDGAVIGLSTSVAGATAQVNGADPAPTVVDVSSLGAIPATGLSVAVTYGAGATGWLDATLAAAAAPTTLTLQPRVTGLAIGTYTATATVSSSLPNVTPRAVTYTFTVAQTASIGLSATTRTFAASSGAASPAAQTIDVTNAGTGALTGLSVTGIAYGAGATGWLAASLSTTAAPSMLTLTATTGALTVGSYTAQVTLGSSLPGVASRTVNVTFNVAQGAQIGLSSTNATLVAQRTDTRSDSVTIDVTNAGTGPLTGLSVTSIAYGPGATGWLVPASSGLEGTTAPTRLGLRANVGSLAVGNYTATVRVGSSLAGVTPRDVAVTFSVADGAVIGLSTSLVPFAVQVQQAAPAPVVVNVTNAGAGGAGALAGLAVQSVTYGPGATGWLGAPATAGTTSPTSVALQPNATNLALGSYSATVRLSSTTPNVAARDITVTYDVTQPASISALPSSRTFSALRSETAPASQTVNVTNAGTGTLDALTATVSYQAGEPTGWLGTPSFNTTTAPAVLTLAPTVGSLAAGTYRATVSVGSTRPGIAAQPVTVTFTVSAGATIGAPATAGLSSQVQQPAPPVDVAITNTGSGTLSGLSAAVGNYAVTSGTPGATGWLAATFVGGDTEAPTTLRLQPSTGALAIGTYTADVTVSSTLPNVTPKVIAVTFTVSQTASISLAAAAAFDAQLAGSAPTSQVVSVNNGGTGVLDGLSVASVSYDAASGGTTWLGTPTLNTGVNPATLTLAPDQAGLALGAYQATVTVQSSRPGIASKQIVVTLNVVQNAVLSLTPGTWTPTLQASATAPATQNVLVTNSGSAGTIAGLTRTIACTTGTAGCPAGTPTWLSATLNGTSANTSMDLSASASSLAANTYSATVTVSSTTPGVASRTVTVTLTVTTAPVINASPTSRSFTVTRGSNPAAQAIDITNTGGGTLSGLSAALLSGGTGWLDGGGALSISNGGVAPAQLTIAPTTSGLTTSPSAATVRISSSVPGVAPVDVTVNVTVQQPVIALNGTSGNITDAMGNVTRGSGGGTRSVNVTNSGQGTLGGLTASSPATFLSGISISPASITTGTATLSYAVNTNLVAGTYNGVITVGSTVPGVADRTVTVTLTVQQPQIGLDNTSFTEVKRVYTDPSTRTVTVSNAGSGTLSGVTVEAITYSAGASGWLVTPTVGQALTVGASFSINPNAINAYGDFTATIRVGSTVPGVNDQNVTITVQNRYAFADAAAIMTAGGCNGCHTETFATYANHFGSATTGTACDAWGARAVAGNGAGSLMYRKMASKIGVAGVTPGCGVAMPTGTSVLSGAQVQLYKDWLDGGAYNTIP